ncbi:MAG: ABC transporter permease subunit, partial [Phreatobacter sp.]
MGIVEAILLTVVTAATPLFIAALGELVTERAGVLNLGVEGMMIIGAATGFAAAILSGSTLVGCLAAIAAGMVMAGLFAALALGLATNQVATGLALTILGLGLSGLIGADFIGARRDPMQKLSLPGLTDLPV